MRPQMWHAVVLIYPILIALTMLGLYWIIRLAVRHGIRDADQRRATGGTTLPPS